MNDLNWILENHAKKLQDHLQGHNVKIIVLCKMNFNDRPDCKDYQVLMNCKGFDGLEGIDKFNDIDHTLCSGIKINRRWSEDNSD